MNKNTPRPPLHLASSTTRRDFLRRSALLAGAATLLPAGRGWGAEANPPTLVCSIRSLSNPYHAVWNRGGAAFAKAVGAPYVTLVTEADSERGTADIRAILSRTGGNVVLNADPNDGPDARPIVEACVKAGAFVTTQWNKPDDLHPWSFNPNYVAHISFDGVRYGRETAEALFKSMGGAGGIIGLGGILSNVPALDRKAGLEKALAANPKVKLLDFQVANWKSSEAFSVVSALLTRFGDQIKGVWAANDDMALGALEALRAENLAGKIKVTGIDGIKVAVEAVRAGEMAATVSWDPFWQGGMGLAIAYAAKTGKFDPAKEPNLHREFYGTGILVTKETADKFYADNIATDPKIDWNDLWGRVTDPIRGA